MGFCGVERGTGKMFLNAVHDRTKETLIGLIQEGIKTGTTVYFDCSKAYETLGGAGYDHLTVNHALYFVDPMTNARTNTIENP
ncbi:DDE_Tnp_IS1595 domain-containing protein [Trichonephila clavipes]|nr:DDE_Tnp_IS1595 domain-containing protein [Trichonephila clavipes]GFT33219.1 DDE_Tnp_IS1595 domain-containing protein [Trichonephila clavipes]GFT33221.1 DDE_Tnp_IS1595 domain-containing protein [Trichonephila clavipes]